MKIEIVLTTTEAGFLVEKVVAQDKVMERTKIKDFLTWYAETAQRSIQPSARRQRLRLGRSRFQRRHAHNSLIAFAICMLADSPDAHAARSDLRCHRVPWALHAKGKSI
jgi:hypothetical protein